MSDAIVGYGTKFQRGDGASPEDFTEVAEIVSISGPSLSRESVDVTHLNSPNDYMEFKAGMKDPGEITLEARFIPTDTTLGQGSDGMLGDYESGETHNYRVEFPDGSTWTIAGFVTGYEVTVGGVNDPTNASITIKITGAPDLEEAS